ncbi:MAG TPA: PKD domain-containing protein, partial [Bacteroidia bacterium]|nr:PKD domain-containing protein [Bacteroidia bacterium]
MKKLTTLFAIVIAFAFTAKAQLITTIAGTGTAAFSGNGGQASAAGLYYPIAVFEAPATGSVYIADCYNNMVRKITASGIISTVAGTGTAGYNGDSIQATASELYQPIAIRLDHAGNLIIADAYNNRIRKVNMSTGIITTIAGTGANGYTGDHGQATAATMHVPSGLAIDVTGNLFISDGYNYTIRKVDTTGIITTYAGTGSQGYNGDGIQASAAQLNNSVGDLAIDNAGNLLICDLYNQRIRKVNHLTGIITTIAGNGTAGYNGDGIQATAAEINEPSSLFADANGNIYFTDEGNAKVRMINSSGILYAIAGTGTQGYNADNIQATAAQLNYPHGIWVNSLGEILIADYWNNRVRKIYSTCAGLDAKFTYVTGAAGQVSFTSTSTIVNPKNITYYWDAGDAKGFSTDSVFTNNYAYNGTYDVNLRLVDTSKGCAADTSIFITITNSATCALHANFTDSIGANGVVYFTNTSTGTSASTSYYWSAGDGIGYGNTGSFNYTYNYNGTYAVNLYLSDANGICTADTTINVTIGNAVICNLHAGFTYTTGPNGSVSFTSTSTGTSATTQMYWYAGDNAGYGYGNTYNYTYQINGTYAVNLYLANYNGTCWSDTTINVTITNANNTTGLCNLGGIVISTRASCDTCKDGNATMVVVGGTGPYTYNWSNGATTASINAGPGIYTCCVTDANSCSACLSTTVSDSCLYAEFSYTITYYTTGINIDSAVIYFVSISDTVCKDSAHGAMKMNKKISYTWNFGDGNT